jgi:hypothetical protein
MVPEAETRRLQLCNIREEERGKNILNIEKRERGRETVTITVNCKMGGSQGGGMEEITPC